MKTLTLILLVSLSIFALGCVGKPPEVTPTPTPTPTPSPTLTETPLATLTPVSTPTPMRNPIFYKVWIDGWYGFHSVRNLNLTMEPLFDKVNKTLNIQVGDVVIWVNDADNPEEKLTVLSNEGLWGNESGILRWRYKEFSYIFNKTGTYNVSIKEYPYRIKPLMIIVSG